MPRIDPEVQAVTQIAELLEPLDGAARVRVLEWAKDRYSLSASSSVLALAQLLTPMKEIVKAAAQNCPCGGTGSVESEGGETIPCSLCAPARRALSTFSAETAAWRIRS